MNLVIVQILILSFAVMNTDTYTIDFGKTKQGGNWSIINDGVMGGLSQGAAILEEDKVVFYGNISLANNGGFSSLKSPFRKTNLADFSFVEIRLKGKGQVFALTLETDQRYWRPYFKKNIAISGDDWETVRLDLNEFKAYSFGRNLNRNLTKEDLAEVLRVGITTNSKKEGPFDLEIDYIQFKQK